MKKEDSYMYHREEDEYKYVDNPTLLELIDTKILVFCIFSFALGLFLGLIIGVYWKL